MLETRARGGRGSVLDRSRLGRPALGPGLGRLPPSRNASGRAICICKAAAEGAASWRGPLGVAGRWPGGGLETAQSVGSSGLAGKAEDSGSDSIDRLLFPRDLPRS